MNYQTISSYKVAATEPIIRLQDGTILCNTGPITQDLENYCFEDIETPVPFDFKVACEMLYQRYMGGWDWEMECVDTRESTIAENINALARVGKTEEALETLVILVFNSDVALLEARLERSRQSYSMGFIDFEENSRNRAQITYAILEITSKFKPIWLPKIKTLTEAEYQAAETLTKKNEQ